MTATGRVLVTPRSLTAEPDAALDALAAAGYDVVYSSPGVLPDEAELLRLVPGCVGWLAGVEPVSPAVVDAARELRAVSRNGVGVDNLPLALLRERGIRVATAGGANASGVAELTLGLMLAALRRIPATDAGIKRGEWPRSRGRELGGRTVGIVGCGAIGRRVADLCLAFGASVLAVDPVPFPVAATTRFRWASVPEVLARADVVTLHCPPAGDGRPLIDAAAIAGMRPRAILINAARGALVDEAAVVAALDAGTLDGYAADAFAVEPPRARSLVEHQRAIATSHVGGFTDESTARATADAVANLLAALRETDVDARG